MAEASNPMLTTQDDVQTSNKARYGFCKRNRASIVCFALILITGLIAMVTIIAVWSNKETKQLHGRFGIVFDVGGSGTRMHLYEYDKNGGMKELLSSKCEGEGATHQTKTVLKEKIMQCLTQAETEIVDPNIVSRIPVYMGASGGMRLLEYDDKDRYNTVLNTLRGILNNSTFVIKYVDTITGHEEGLYSWMTVNYLFGNHLSKNLLEVGSTSFQFAFEVSDQLPESVTVSKVNMFDSDVHVFSRSRLCYGIREFSRRYRALLLKDSKFSKVTNDPCSFTGFNKSFNADYFHNASCITGKLAIEMFGESLNMPTSNEDYMFKGVGSFEQCVERLDKTLSVGGHAKNNVTKIQKDFAAVGGGTYFASVFLNLPMPANLNEYRNATKILCNTPYEKLQQWKGYSRFVFQYCLADSYTFYLLKNIIGIDTNAKIEFLRKINGVSLSWPLGMMLRYKDEMTEPSSVTIRRISEGTFVAILVISICFICASAMAFMIFFKVWSRKPSPTRNEVKENGA